MNMPVNIFLDSSLVISEGSGPCQRWRVVAAIPPEGFAPLSNIFHLLVRPPLLLHDKDEDIEAESRA